MNKSNNMWYVKDLSKLTNVSVQTLHHYDKIGLLEPSVRFANGYRSYSERDLLKLQQIIALKFFGFKLTQIKAILEGETDALESFSIQSQLLEQKAQNLLEASATLKGLLADCNKSKSIPWKTIIKLIEVYRMTEKLEHPWIGKILSQEQLKEYAEFEASLKTRFSPDQKKAYENEWEDLAAQIHANLDKDPTSDFGKKIGKHCMDLVNTFWGMDHVGLRNTVWEKGYKSGQVDEKEHGLSTEAIAWLDKAVAAYYGDILLGVLAQVGKSSDSEVLKSWNSALKAMHGDDKKKDKEVLDIALNDKRVSQEAKQWLKKTFKE